jgi:hypothetical protein
MYTFAGGCVTYQFSFIAGAAPSLAIPLDTAIAFEPRSVLVEHAVDRAQRAWRRRDGIREAAPQEAVRPADRR